MRSPARLIRTAAERHGARHAVLELTCPGAGQFLERRRATYGELYEHTLRLCSALCASGLRAGDRIAVVLDNSIELVVTEWACLMAGYVWVALNTRTSAAELRAIVADSRPAILFVGDRHVELVRDSGVQRACRVVRVGEEWHALLAAARDVGLPREPRAEDPVRIRYTSGTAGKPKGAVLPRRAYDASIDVVAEVVGPLGTDDVLLQVAPMSHAAGAMLLPHVAVGARAVLADHFDHEAFVAVIERYGVTATLLVPTMLVRVLGVLGQRRDLGSMRTIVYGGAAMPVEPLAHAVMRLGQIFVQIYGLTESTWPVTALSREAHLPRPGESQQHWRRRLASCGKPTRVGELRIVDGRGHDVPTGMVGEVWVRGRNTMSGYWGSATQDLKGIDADGWMHTGDVAFQDAEGFVTIVDRLHDMIVSGGFNVYPREVEDALCSHPAVLEAAVVGRLHREWGETVHAAVVLKTGASATADELIEHCASLIAGYKKPRTVEIVDALPKNPAGKILRRALRTQT